MPSERTLKLLSEAELVGPPEYDPAWDEVERFGGRAMYYDRDGEPLTLRQWSMLWALPFEDYRMIDFTEIGPYHVSTVWLGLDSGFGFGGPPVIFESMVFENEISVHEESESPWGKMPRFEYHEAHDQRRYSTEAGARAGHAELVKEINVILAATEGIDTDGGVADGEPTHE